MSARTATRSSIEVAQAAADAAEVAALDLRDELNGLDTALRSALLAGDGDAAVAVHARAQVLPVLITAADVRAASARIALAEARIEDLDERSVALAAEWETAKAARDAAANAATPLELSGGRTLGSGSSADRVAAAARLAEVSRAGEAHRGRRRELQSMIAEDRHTIARLVGKATSPTAPVVRSLPHAVSG